jgi:hypothetical protein
MAVLYKVNGERVGVEPAAEAFTLMLAAIVGPMLSCRPEELG